ncbi:hypothetical protein I552_2511 [Mycobacterium xenopi 3993]|nr:hypothetical protein I552_2511 [Mycobacterium xenopi 3993]
MSVEDIYRAVVAPVRDQVAAKIVQRYYLANPRSALQATWNHPVGCMLGSGFIRAPSLAMRLIRRRQRVASF